MPIIQNARANREQLAADIERATQNLGPDVVRVRHHIGPDWSDEPSIYFRIVLADSATTRERSSEVTQSIRRAIDDELRPQENWGLRCYFSFRRQSEQANRPQDLEWE